MSEIDELRKSHFMSLAPMYLITSAYTMQAALTTQSAGLLQNISFTTLALLSWAFLIVTIWLVVAGFVTLPSKLRLWTYGVGTGLGIISALILVIDWLERLIALMKLNASPIYVTAFFYIGFALYFAILVFNVIHAAKFTLETQKT